MRPTEAEGEEAAPGVAEAVSSPGTSASDCRRGRLPWSIVATEALFDLERETLTLRGADLRIADRKLIPLPRMTLPTSRRSGLLAPQVGQGTDGLQIEQPVYLTLGASA